MNFIQEERRQQLMNFPKSPKEEVQFAQTGASACLTINILVLLYLKMRCDIISYITACIQQLYCDHS